MPVFLASCCRPIFLNIFWRFCQISRSNRAVSAGFGADASPKKPIYNDSLRRYFHRASASDNQAASMIRVENLAKFFGTKRAVDGVSFSVERGEVLGFLGPNGAGKSTTMRMITGFIPPTEGTVSVGGFDIVEHPIEARRLIGYLPENAPAYTDMNVLGFLNFAAEIRGLRGET